MFKNIKSYLIFGSISIIVLILLFNKIFTIALVILGLGAFVWFLWEFLLKDKQKRINSLNEELINLKADKSKMAQEIEDYSKRKLNISEVNTILELGLFEVNTNFKRTINKQFKVKDKNVQFIGVLNVDFIAKYGVDFRKIMFKMIEETKEISISNANPEFLSFTKRTSSWEIAEILEFNTPFLGIEHWRTNPKLNDIATKIKEETRIQVEKESENGPTELKWIVEPLRKHVERALELIIGVQGYKIRFTQLDDSENYKSFFDYTKESGKEYLDTNSEIEHKSLSDHETL